MARSDVHPVHHFKGWQVWPGSYDNKPTEHYPLRDKAPFLITKETKIASMGSCFAREIKTVLLDRGYSYITKEVDKPAAKHASAAWERLYNTFSMRQVFDYTFNNWIPELKWWNTPKTNRIQDPYRRIILYDSQTEAEIDFAEHINCSRSVLQTAEVLILTLGLTEIWRDMHDGAVICLPSGPYVNEGGDMSRYEFVTSRYKENLENLVHIYQTIKKVNPFCKMILTVSPVHMWATFREDSDIISSSCNSKSTLRAVADEFCSLYDDVVYFPAYEIATIYRPLLGKSIFEPGRENFHVNRDVIHEIMDVFFQFFCK